MVQIQAERDQARQALAEAQVRWETRLDTLATDIAAERQVCLADREELEAELRAARETREARIEGMATDLTEPQLRISLDVLAC